MQINGQLYLPDRKHSFTHIDITCHPSIHSESWDACTNGHTLFSRSFCITDTLFSRSFCIYSILFCRSLKKNRIFASQNIQTLQQLRLSRDNNTYYWSADNSRGEIDFLVQRNDIVIPIEVKQPSGKKSSPIYRSQPQPTQHTFLNVPLPRTIMDDQLPSILRRSRDAVNFRILLNIQALI